MQTELGTVGMSDLRDLLHFLAAEGQQQEYSRLLDSLGYLDPTDDAFGLNKWTHLLYQGSRNEEHGRQEFHEHNPTHLVSVLAIPGNFLEVELDVNSKTFREWITELKWDYCSVLDSPFSNAQPQACREGLLIPVWLNWQWRTVLEKYLVVRRNGVTEFGLSDDVFYYQPEGQAVFNFIRIAARLWQFLGFYAELCDQYFEGDTGNVTYVINIRGTKNAFLGNLASGWRQPNPQSLGWHYIPRCLDKHLQCSRTVDIGSSDAESLVRWFATRIDNAWGQFEPRCYVHESVDESRPFAYPRKR